jgi:uncharacterized protein YacL
MAPHQTINLLRTLFVILSCLIGTMIGREVMGSELAGGMAGTVFGLLMVLFDRLLKGVTLRLFSSATFGLLLGLIAARLLLASNVLRYLSEENAWVISLIAYCGVGYLGMMLAMRSNRDEFSLIIPYVRFRQSGILDTPVLIDTNIVIDGRLGEVCATGFLSSSIVVPRFVIEELQRLGDSAEPLKRERGRRGLENLAGLQKNPQISLTIHEAEPDPEVPVDTQLVQLAKLLQTRLLTNDGTLCKIARLQGVQALNLNELSNTVRSTLATGDEIELVLSKEGRDAHQAVGYLPDGTMIVVNHGRPLIGKTVMVTIAGTLQTTAGRMFFAELKP